VATAVAGLATPIGSASATIAVRDIAGELSAANSTIATLRAELAAERAARAADKVASDSATATAIANHKKSFNDLAKKWNKKNPRAKVALIK
jgi:hypothetical protein